jgi:hypothetical protein
MLAWPSVDYTSGSEAPRSMACEPCAWRSQCGDTFLRLASFRRTAARWRSEICLAVPHALSELRSARSVRMSLSEKPDEAQYLEVRFNV